jgi:polyisoprenyl-teichoic acid--peptidoglycan teichoic acid transferase
LNQQPVPPTSQSNGEGATTGKKEVSSEVESPINAEPSIDTSQSHVPSRFAPKLATWAVRGGAIGLTAILSATLGTAVALMLPLPKPMAPQGEESSRSITELWTKSFNYRITRPVHVLVMGIDLPLDLPEDKSPDDVFAGRSDTMMLVRIDPTTESVNVLSIPRDTQVNIPGEDIDKINHANLVGGAHLAAEVVSQNLNGVTIDRYVRVSTGAFRELVDLMGGVEVYVPERMEYEDQTQKLKIDLQPGHQVLNGEQAEQFARFRNDANGDIGRVQRQQQLIQALRQKLTDPTLIPRIPQAIELFQTYIDTNLSMQEMLALANFGLGLEQENFRMVLLPGRFSTPEEYVASYWLMDVTAKDQVMQAYFDLSSVAVLSHQDSLNDLSIAVQNASADPQLGSQVVAYLQSQGFYNTYLIEDWTEVQAQTQIIAQRGDIDSAEQLEFVLGVGQVVPASIGDIQSDLTIRIGEDWVESPQI